MRSGDQNIPDRFRRAVGYMAIRRADRVLEIGCGPGVAAGLVCDRLATGKLVALDRSGVAIARARERNAAHVKSQRLELLVGELVGAKLPFHDFTAVFAINVNCFWTRDASAELAVVHACLRPSGRFALFYEAPSSGDAKLLQCSDIVSRALRANRFIQVRAMIDRTGRKPLLALSAVLGK